MVGTIVVGTTTTMETDIEMVTTITGVTDTIMVIDIKLKMGVMDTIQVKTIITTETKEMSIHVQEIEIVQQILETEVAQQILETAVDKEILHEQETHIQQDQEI